MRDSAGRRLAYAVFFALLAGLLAAFNPVDQLKTTLLAEGHSAKHSLGVAKREISKLVDEPA